MLIQAEQVEQKFSGFHSAIDNWLSERKQLLVQYCQLAGMPPFERESQVLPDKQAIQAFCSTLMDYLSAGHFEVYDKIMSECEQEDEGQRISPQLIPRITDTTDKALSFHDTFADSDNEHDLTEFDVKLSRLGQELEERFELEDQLIQVLHSKQQDTSQS